MRTDEEQNMRAQQTLRFVASRMEAHAAPENPSPLKIVGVYADLQAHMLAMDVLRDIARNRSAVGELSAVWWDFEMLKTASVRETAARAAADADMIWCSTHACEGLPETVRTWTDSWSKHRNESERALVALLRCPAGYIIERSPSRAHLCQLAGRTGMQLFVERFDCGCRASVAAHPQTTLPLANSWLIQSESVRGQIRWGINE